MPLVGTGRRVEDDDAPVAEAVGDVDLIGRAVDGDGGRSIQAGLAVVPAGLSRLADLQEELSRARELEDVRVLGARRCGARGAAPRPRAPAVSATPAAAIQTLPWASTAIPPGDRGQA